MRISNHRVTNVLRLAFISCLVPSVAFGLSAEPRPQPVDANATSTSDVAAPDGELPTLVPPYFEDPDADDVIASAAPDDSTMGIAAKRQKGGKGKRIGRHVGARGGHQFGGKGGSRMLRHGLKKGGKKARKKFGL
jgi:hypothetical protein